MSGKDFGERALARPVRAHDRVHLAGADRELDALEDLDAGHGGGQAAHLQQRAPLHQPTLPSSFRPRSLVASTANSIGSCVNTSRQKPLIIIDTASSAPMPRCAK